MREILLPTLQQVQVTTKPRSVWDLDIFWKVSLLMSDFFVRKLTSNNLQVLATRPEHDRKLLLIDLVNEL